MTYPKLTGHKFTLLSLNLPDLPILYQTYWTQQKLTGRTQNLTPLLKNYRTYQAHQKAHQKAIYVMK